MAVEILLGGSLWVGCLPPTWAGNQGGKFVQSWFFDVKAPWGLSEFACHWWL